MSFSEDRIPVFFCLGILAYCSRLLLLPGEVSYLSPTVPSKMSTPVVTPFAVFLTLVERVHSRVRTPLRAESGTSINVWALPSLRFYKIIMVTQMLVSVYILIHEFLNSFSKNAFCDNKGIQTLVSSHTRT